MRLYILMKLFLKADFPFLDVQKECRPHLTTLNELLNM